MKTLCNLPESITLPNGAVLKPVIGGHLDQKPFLTADNTDGIVDCTKMNWGTALLESPGYYENTEAKLIVRVAKKLKLKHRKVSVLGRNLRGKRDLHGSPYRGNTYIFVEVKP